MKKIIKSKKAMDINVEVILYIMTIIVVFVAIYFGGVAVSNSKIQAEKMAPELSYQYPVTFIKSFLMLEIDKTDVKNLSLDESKEYYIKDLIYIGSTDSKNIVNQMKDDYISKLEKSDSLESFEKFSKISIIKNELLYIDYEQSSAPNLDLLIKNKNYAFYFISEDSKYRTVYFMGDS